MKREAKSPEECLQEAAEFERLANLTPFGINPQDIGIVRILLAQAGRKGGRTGPHAFALTCCKEPCQTYCQPAAMAKAIIAAICLRILATWSPFDCMIRPGE